MKTKRICLISNILSGRRAFCEKQKIMIEISFKFDLLKTVAGNEQHPDNLFPFVDQLVGTCMQTRLMSIAISIDIHPLYDD